MVRPGQSKVMYHQVVYANLTGISNVPTTGQEDSRP